MDPKPAVSQADFPAWERCPTGSAVSKDGTVIGFRWLGQGPGLVLVQGAMGTAFNFFQLAGLLSDAFTVYLPDRRGRGLSPLPYGKDYSVRKDVEDLDALLRKTGAHFVFGLSSGAIIALQAALTLPAIRQTAIFEPPLLLQGLPVALMARFEREIGQGKISSALITGMKIAKIGPPVFNLTPRPLLEAMTKKMLAAKGKKTPDGYEPLSRLTLALQYDFHIVAEMSSRLESFQGIRSEVLLMGGSQSPAYLKTGLDALERVLPKARRVELPNLGHAAAWNSDRGGQPEPVAQALLGFFK